MRNKNLFFIIAVAALAALLLAGCQRSDQKGLPKPLSKAVRSLPTA